MKTKKSTRIIYWVATILFVGFEGVIPAFTSNSQVAIEGMHHLGYPNYFRIMLSVFKVIGALVIILPMIPKRIKEWAYAGFTFTMISAIVSYLSVDGITPLILLPLIFLGVLATSFFTLQKMRFHGQADDGKNYVTSFA